ncbi:MAG TPA: LapA family protein, partial [Anaerolineales bacterium]|nr:LapA family protein [Anaerolineales bacterium]
MTILVLILTLAFAIAAVIFALQNPTMITVSLFGYNVDGSLALFILLAVIMGIIIGILVMAPSAVKRSFELRS